MTMDPVDVTLPSRGWAAGGGSGRRSWIAVLLAAGCATTLFTGALYELSSWGPAMLLVLALVIALLLSGPVRLTGPAKLAIAALIGLAGWAMLSMLWAESVDSAWLASNRLALYAALLFAGTQLIRNDRAGARVLVAIGGGVGALALYFVGRMLLGDGSELFFEQRLEGPIGYINGTAGVLAMGLWPLLALATSSSAGRAWRGAGLGLATLEAQLLVLTQSRAVVPVVVLTVGVVLVVLPRRLQTAFAVLATAAATAAILPLTLGIYPGDQRAASQFPDAGALQDLATVVLALSIGVGVVWTAASDSFIKTTLRLSRHVAVPMVILAVAGLAVVAVQTGPAVEKRGRALLAMSAEPGTGSGSRFTRGGSGRADLWRVAWVQFRSKPLLGLGAGNYSLTYYQLRRSPDAVLQPHSIELQALAELGVVGALALLAVLLAGLAAIVTRIRACPASVAPVTLAATGVVVTWTVHTSVDWLHNLPAVTGLAVLALAVLLATPEATAREPRRLPPKLLPVIAAVAAALVAMSVGRELQANRALASGWKVLSDDPKAALSDSGKAQDLNPASVDAGYLAAAAYARQGSYFRARDALLDTAAEEPRNHVPWVLLRDLARRRGDRVGARAADRAVKRLDPLERVPAEAAAAR